MPKGYPKSGINKGWLKKGHIVSDEERAAISQRQMGHPSYVSSLKGIPRSDEVKEKIRQGQNRLVAAGTHQLLGKGKLSKAWKGGVSKFRFERGRTMEEISGREKPEVCDICGGGGMICFDHDHETGEFRGWICFHCNTTLGFARDKTEVLQKMIDYLNNSKRVKLTVEELRRLGVPPIKKENAP